VSLAEEVAVSLTRPTWIPSRRRLLVGVTVFLALLVVAAVGVYVYADPYPVEATATDAARETPGVVVESTGDGYLIAPESGDATTGLVFYTGALVQPESYVSTFAPVVAERNVAVFVPKLPLNLAILDTDAASSIIDDNPGIEQWYVGGHSLGGAMACGYAGNNADRVEGLVLFGAYCDSDVSETNLSALVVTGSQDAILDADDFESSRDNLPSDSELVDIEGMNHSQFGAYGGQPGDDPATISDEAARQELTEVVVSWLDTQENQQTDATLLATSRISAGRLVSVRGSGI
jgi:hypothetical protein